MIIKSGAALRYATWGHDESKILFNSHVVLGASDCHFSIRILFIQIVHSDFDQKQFFFTLIELRYVLNQVQHSKSQIKKQLYEQLSNYL